MANHPTLESLFTATADAIREKSGETGSIMADNFPAAIRAIPGVKPMVVYKPRWATVRHDNCKAEFKVPVKDLWLVTSTMTGLSTNSNYVLSMFIDVKSGYQTGRKTYWNSDYEELQTAGLSGTVNVTVADGVVTLQATSSYDYLIPNSLRGGLCDFVFIGESSTGENVYSFVIQKNASDDYAKTLPVGEGMTWSEWVASEHNDIGCYIGSDNKVYYSNGKTINNIVGSSVGSAALSTEVIKPLTTYNISGW